MVSNHEIRKGQFWQKSQRPAIGMMIIFLILLLSNGPNHAESEQGNNGHDPTPYRHAGLVNDGHHNFSRSMREELNLTDQQKQTFDQIEADYEKMVVKKTAEIRIAEIDLAAMLAIEEPNRQAIQKKVNAIGEIKKDMMMARIDSLLTLKALLTKGQYETFREILHQRMAPMLSHMPHQRF